MRNEYKIDSERLKGNYHMGNLDVGVKIRLKLFKNRGVRLL